VTTSTTIKQYEDTLLQAMLAHDVEKLDALLHDDLLFITPDGQTITKSMDLDAHRKGLMVIERISTTIEQINIIGDNAVVTLLMDTKGKMIDMPIEGRFRYIRVWKKLGADFKVIGGSCTAL
jgi:ketosteroid isomerase-like protein